MLAFLIGILLTGFNALLAIFLLKKALNKKRYTDFSDYVFRSIGIRALIVLFAFWLIVQFTAINVIIFSITFVISYFLFIIVEIVFINNYFKR